MLKRSNRPCARAVLVYILGGAVKKFYDLIRQNCGRTPLYIVCVPLYYLCVFSSFLSFER